MTEQFTSSTQVYISTSQIQQDYKVSTSDSNASKSMAGTYCIILESKHSTDL